MGFTVNYSAPPLLQGLGAYLSGYGQANRQTQDTQARIDAQNSASLNNALAGLASGVVTGGLAGHYYGKANQPTYGPSTGYGPDGMGPPGILPGEHDWMNRPEMNGGFGRERSLLMTQMLLGGPQAASGYLANQEQFRNRMIAQDDAQAFGREERIANQEFRTSDREARQEYATSEREAAQNYYLNDQLPARAAYSLGTTPEALETSGREFLISQGTPPAQITPQTAIAAGMQAQQLKNAYNTSDVRVAEAIAMGKRPGGKMVLSPAAQRQRTIYTNALSEMQQNPEYWNPGTGWTARGIVSRQRLESEIQGIDSTATYQEPPPTAAMQLGFRTPVQGPPQAGQPPHQDLPGYKILSDSPMQTTVQLPTGHIQTWSMDPKGGFSLRVDKPVETQPVAPTWPAGRGVGETWEENGYIFTRNRFNEVSSIGEVKGGPSQPAKDIFGPEEKAKMLIQLAKGAPDVEVKDEKGEVIGTRKASPDEAQAYAINQYDWMQQTVNPLPPAVYNKIQSVKQPGDTKQRAMQAMELMADGYIKPDELPSDVFSEVGKMMQSNLQNMSNAANSGQRVMFKKDGKTYSGVRQGNKFVDVVEVK